MLRETFNAAVADFLLRNWLSPLGQSVAPEEGLPPSLPAAALPAVFEHSPVNEQSPSGSRASPWTRTSLCSHVLLGKGMDTFLDSFCTQNNFKWLKEMNCRIWRRTQRIKQQLLRITMLKKQPAKTGFIVKPKTMHIWLLQIKLSSGWGQ